jgi:hypothetical protein
MKVHVLYIVLILGQLIPIQHAPRTPELDQLCGSISKEEQRAFIKLSVCLGVPHIEIYNRLHQAAGLLAYSRSRTLELANEFQQEGRTETCDRPRSGRPRTAMVEDNVLRVQELLRDNENLRADDIAIELNLSHGSVINILHDLDYHFVMSGWVPHELNAEQREQRIRTAMNNILWVDERESNLRSLIAIDETWIASDMPVYGKMRLSICI